MKVPLTPLDFLERARRLYGPLEAVVDDDRRFSYLELAARAHRLGHALEVAPGQRVAYLCPNTVELLEAYYGVVLAGAILTPLNIRLAAAEMQDVIDDCRPALPEPRSLRHGRLTLFSPRPAAHRGGPPRTPLRMLRCPLSTCMTPTSPVTA